MIFTVSILPGHLNLAVALAVSTILLVLALRAERRQRRKAS